MDIDKIYEKLNILYFDAQNQVACFPKGDLEWEIGIGIIYAIAGSLNFQIMDMVDYYTDYDKKDCISQLMGIPIRINYENPECIKLWREVK